MAEDRPTDSEDNTQVSGIVSHIEFLTDDPQKSSDFYKAVFGWEISHYSLDGAPYIGWNNPEGGVPGGFRKKSDGERACIVNYVKTFDIDRDIELIRQRGGVFSLEKRHIPEVGWISRFKDPFGNVLGLFQPNGT